MSKLGLTMSKKIRTQNGSHRLLCFYNCILQRETVLIVLKGYLTNPKTTIKKKKLWKQNNNSKSQTNKSENKIINQKKTTIQTIQFFNLFRTWYKRREASVPHRPTRALWIVFSKLCDNYQSQRLFIKHNLKCSSKCCTSKKETCSLIQSAP